MRHTEIVAGVRETERDGRFAYGHAVWIAIRVYPRCLINGRGVNESQSCSCGQLSRQPITSIHYHIGLLCARQFFFFFLPFSFLSLYLSLSLSRFEFRSRNFSQLKSSSHAKQHGNGTFAIRASRFEKKKTKNRRIHSVVYFQHGMTR